ncbi:MAG: hypothetical protein R2991_13980 [Thermoanaerobaculia bacterium]
MADKFELGNPEQVEYKAFARRFDGAGDDGKGTEDVLCVMATLTYPRAGWRVLLTPQEGEDATWRLLAEEPAYGEDVRTYYTTSASTRRAPDAVPPSVRVIDGRGTQTVPVEPWGGAATER